MGKRGLYGRTCFLYERYNEGGKYLELLAQHFKCTPEKARCSKYQALMAEDTLATSFDTQAVGVEFCYQCDEYEKGEYEKFGRLRGKPFLNRRMKECR